MMRGIPGVLVLLAGLLSLIGASAAPAMAAGGGEGDDVVAIVTHAATGERIGRANAWMLPVRVPVVVRTDGTFVIPALRDRADTGDCRIQIVAEGFEPRTVPCPRDAAPTLPITLTPTPLRTHEALTVTATRAEAEAFELPATTAVVSAEDLERRLPRTTPEALMDTPGVWVQKTNHGGGSPFVRGLVGNQILVLVDGVRLNNATFRYGPNQYLATIDPGQIERIEVLRGGGGSVLYGSDALGGVVHVITRQPRLAASGTSFDIGTSGRIVSEDMERSGRVNASFSSARVGLLGGVAVRDYGDLVAGGDLGVEAPSAYRETNGDVALLAQLAPRARLTVSYQHVHQFDVPRFDQVAQRGFARYSFDPQIRQLGMTRLSTESRHAWARAVSVTGSWQRSFERRERQTRGSATFIAEEDRVTSIGALAQAHTAAWHGWSLRYGADVYSDAVRSSRSDLNTTTGVSQAVRGLYPDGASALAAAGFASANLEARRLTLDLGTRFTRTSLDARDARFGDLNPVSQALIGSAAAAFAVTPDVRLFGSLSQGFRAPNLDDVSTLGLFDSGIEVPSPALDPERSVAIEAGVKWRADRTSATLSLWRTNLDALIDRVRARLDGSDVLDGQRIYQRQNVGEANVYGVELEIERVVAGALTAYGWGAYARGQQTTAGQPMRRIPPFNGAAGLRWTGGRWWGALQLRGAARQDRLAQGDKDDHRMNPNGTPGWMTVGVNATCRLSDGVRIVGGAENLLDRAYRIHGSGVDGYGRYVWAGLHVGIQ